MLSTGLLLSLAVLTSAPAYPVVPRLIEEPIRVPFTKCFASNWTILVDASIDGKKVNKAFLDSGAGVSVVDPSIKDYLGFKQVREMLVSDGGGSTVKGLLATASTIAIGDASLTNAPVLILALPDGAPTKTVIGFQLFQKYVVKADFTNKELVLYDRKSFVPPIGATRLPVEMVHGTRPVIEATVDSRKGRFLLDTGNTGGLILNAGFVKDIDLEKTHKLLDRGSGGRTVIGKRESSITRIDELKFAGFVFKQPIANCLKKAGAAEKDMAGNIGIEVFRQFDATFDFPNKVIYLVPNKNYGKRIAYERAGFTYDPSPEGYKVSNVLRGTPADEAGIKSGEILVALDSKPMESLDGIERRELLRQEPGTKLKVTLSSGGKTRTVELILREIL